MTYFSLTKEWSYLRVAVNWLQNITSLSILIEQNAISSPNDDLRLSLYKHKEWSTLFCFQNKIKYLKWKVDGSWICREEQTVKLISECSATLKIFQVVKVSIKAKEAVSLYI